MTSATLDVSPLHELVGRQGALGAGRLAVRSPMEQLTYDELIRRSHTLSAQLMERDGRPDIPVAVYLPRGPQFVAAALGILESGGEVLPIDSATPPDRVGRILESAHATMSPTGRGRERRDGSREGAATRPMVVSRDGAWVAEILEAQLVCPLTPGDTMLHAAAVESPDAVMEMFWPLCVGATVAAIKAPDAQSRLLACHRYRATAMVVPARELGDLLDFQRAQSLLPPPLLRHVICTGDPVPSALAQRFTDQIGRHGCWLHSVSGVGDFRGWAP